MTNRRRISPSPAPLRDPAPAGFTLVEVLISMSVMLVLGAAALTSILLIGRGNMALGNYTQMNAGSRMIIEQMGRDVRQMSTITTATASMLAGTSTAQSGSGTQALSYVYDPGMQTLTRSVNGTVVATYRDISEFSFTYYNALNAPTSTVAQIKQVQLVGRTRTLARTETTGRILSAQFTVRS
ncbi:MAG TPA: prepilin-type N-terminal cleavage/methylation domain-containing protein [Candidatus Synoicihabitans sp.]|nr:prepilin-type N-terminal cleavage/methylation domain-containing protein [Candidatus Synoicihabitans sp.]